MVNAKREVECFRVSGQIQKKKLKLVIRAARGVRNFSSFRIHLTIASPLALVRVEVAAEIVRRADGEALIISHAGETHGQVRKGGVKFVEHEPPGW